MDELRQPITTLLSQALVAYRIEADHLYESLAPHRAAKGPVWGGGPWLTWMAMWMNCLRHLTDGPLTAGIMRPFAGEQIAIRDLPVWTGMSKEFATSTRFVTI